MNVLTRIFATWRNRAKVRTALAMVRESDQRMNNMTLEQRRECYLHGLKLIRAGITGEDGWIKLSDLHPMDGEEVCYVRLGYVYRGVYNVLPDQHFKSNGHSRHWCRPDYTPAKDIPTHWTPSPTPLPPKLS